MVHPYALIGALVLLAACEEPTDRDPTTPGGRADRVLDAPGLSDGPFGDPERAANGVRGTGASAGSTDVFSLARDGDAASITLEWTAGPVFDGPGPDIVVFENPFDHSTGTFFDPVVLEVSAEGEVWVPFPHDYLASDELEWSSDPAHWLGFAGLTPVLLHEEHNPVDPLDPALAGGDGFDLADLGERPEADAIRAQGACCVRLWSASAWENPDSGAPYPKHPIGNGADIDGVYGRVE